MRLTVFETREKIGGILRYGIPEFRLPKSILDRYYRRMRDMGILFRPNFELGDKIAIIGAGNAAMDVARTAIRHGSKDVTVYVRGDKVAASENEYNYAVLDGVHFEFKKNIVRIVDEGAVFCDRVEDPETGKLVDDHSTDTLVEADSVMISISQVPRDRLVSKDHDLHLNQRGTLQIDDQGETTMDGVFASGDVVTGAKTVVAAVAAAKQIAENMDAYMQEKFGNKSAE